MDPTGMTYAMAAMAITSTLVGGGMQFYGQQQQAQNAAAIANWNYQAEQQNAKIAAEAARQTALNNQTAAIAQRDAQIANATMMDNQALAVEAAGREDAKRMRLEKAKLLAAQRVRYSAAGVTSEGSPLDVMADTAGVMEQAIQDQAYETNLESSAWRRKAQLSRADADLTAFDATLAGYEAASADIGRKIDMNTAKINRMSGMADASGLRLGSYGTLMSSFSQATSMGASYPGTIQQLRLNKVR